LWGDFFFVASFVDCIIVEFPALPGLRGSFQLAAAHDFAQKGV
jgi:hypothetical protein